MADNDRHMATKTEHVWETDNLLKQVAAIRHGIPVSELRFLIEYLQVSRTLAAHVLRMSPRTLERRTSGHQLLKPAESERVVRLGAVFRLAVEVLGDNAAAQRWFQKSRAELSGDTPFEHCDTEPGRIEVERVLGRIADGVYA
jgi:putative toxin-antitoxin system antitoxin component (TIGR02293 family)